MLEDLFYVALIVGLFFLFWGEPDVFDALRLYAMHALKGA